MVNMSDAAPLANTSPVWRRAWHPVAHAEEVTADAPVQVLIAGEAWAIARLDGRLVGFEDRCPHRLAPLSAGQVTGSADGTARLTCAYHGWRFDAAGRCDLIPALGREGKGGAGHISKRARLRAAHAVTEHTGSCGSRRTSRCPAARVPRVGRAGNDKRPVAHRAHQGRRGQLVDNFLDAAHFPFVHAASFGVTDDAPLEAGDVTTAGWRVTGVFDTPYRDGGAVVTHRVTKTAGPYGTAHVRLELPGVTIGILLACQPEDWAATRVFQADHPQRPRRRRRQARDVHQGGGPDPRRGPGHPRALPLRPAPLDPAYRGPHAGRQAQRRVAPTHGRSGRGDRAGRLAGRRLTFGRSDRTAASAPPCAPHTPADHQ